MWRQLKSVRVQCSGQMLEMGHTHPSLRGWYVSITLSPLQNSRSYPIFVLLKITFVPPSPAQRPLTSRTPHLGQQWGRHLYWWVPQGGALQWWCPCRSPGSGRTTCWVQPHRRESHGALRRWPADTCPPCWLYHRWQPPCPHPPPQLRGRTWWKEYVSNVKRLRWRWRRGMTAHTQKHTCDVHFSHGEGGHAVCNKCSRDSLCYGLIRCQSGSLVVRPRLRAVHALQPAQCVEASHHTYTQTQSYYHSCSPINISTITLFSHSQQFRLTECGPVSSCGQRAGVAVCENGHRVPRDARQDVLGAIVTNLPVVIDVTLQHVFDPGNYTVGGGPQEVGIEKRLRLPPRT